MIEKRVIRLQRKAKEHRGPADEATIRRQIEEFTPLMTNADPRAVLHLDTTKLSFHKERVEAWRRGEHVAPLLIDTALTQKCSYSCTFCFAGLQQLDSTPVSWERHEMFLEDCAEIGVKAISLVSDGESTECPHFVDFVLKAKSLGLDIAVGTNGLKLTRLDELAEALTYIRININAASPSRNAKIMGTSVANHHKVLANIAELVRIKREGGYPVTIGLQQVLLPEYADQVLPLAILGRSLGVDYLVIKHCSDDENGRLGVDYGWYKSELAQDLFQAAERITTPTYSVQAKWSKFKTGSDRTYSRCFGTPLLLQMSGSGVIAPCGSFFSDKYRSFHIGDIKTTRFKEIWQSEAYKKITSHLASDQFDPRRQCASLCLQDKVNEALFDWVEHGTPIPDSPTQAHRNFI